jgi:hypothetical protein
MSTDLVTIATFAEPAEATLARGVLQEEGIPCFLEGEEVIAALWMLGNATGGVKLQVPREYAERAVAILDDAAPHREEEPVTAEPDPADFEAEAADPAEAAEARETDPGDAMAARAFRAAVLGIFILPPLVSLYSTWLLLRLSPNEKPLSTAGTWKCCLALAVNLLVCGFVVVLVRLICRS